MSLGKFSTYCTHEQTCTQNPTHTHNILIVYRYNSRLYIYTYCKNIYIYMTVTRASVQMVGPNRTNACLRLWRCAEGGATSTLSRHQDHEQNVRVLGE